MEKYKDVAGYEGNYKISNYGKVISLRRNGTVKKDKYISIQKNIDGYSVCTLYKNNKRKMYRVCRLVAKEFIPNPFKLPCVNHKDESKDNDYIDNLEWCSVKYNINYGTAIERGAIKRGKRVGQYSIYGELIKTFITQAEAQKQTGFRSRGISRCCLGQRKTYMNFLWKTL